MPKVAGEPRAAANFGVSASAPLDSAVGVPSVRFVIGISWAPRFQDADADGIADDKDDCPELAEDKDGVEDDDGCPEE